jgi:putative endonuclease
MENYFVYILYSENIDSYYVGQSINPVVRLAEHNSHLKNRAFTKRADDWKVFLTIQCESRTQAILIEKHIKKMKSKKYLNNLKAIPDMVLNLLQKYC